MKKLCNISPTCVDTIKLYQILYLSSFLTLRRISDVNFIRLNNCCNRYELDKYLINIFDSRFVFYLCLCFCQSPS